MFLNTRSILWQHTKKWSAPKGDNCKYDFVQRIIFELNRKCSPSLTFLERIRSHFLLSEGVNCCLDSVLTQFAFKSAKLCLYNLMGTVCLRDRVSTPRTAPLGVCCSQFENRVLSATKMKSHQKSLFIDRFLSNDSSSGTSLMNQ